MNKPDARQSKIMWAAAEREIWLRSLRKKIKNRDFSIISNTCVGGYIYKDLQLPFLTPTVALSMKLRDLIRMCFDLKGYMGEELVEVRSDKPYPVGRIADIQINFVHYDSFDEARAAWNRRKERINYDNIFVIVKEDGHISPQRNEDFQRIPYPKVMLVSHPTDEPNEFYIPGFEQRGVLGDIIQYQDYRRRYFEQFDFVSFLDQAASC